MANRGQFTVDVREDGRLLVRINGEGRCSNRDGASEFTVDQGEAADLGGAIADALAAIVPPAE